MTDQQRLLGFLVGAGLPHEVVMRPDVEILPDGAEDISFVRYATVVLGWGNDDYLFNEHGRLVGIRRTSVGRR